MVFSAMVTNSMVEGDWSHLLGVGVTFIIVGLIMVMVNRIITAREEEELAKYVSQRLARTRSGYNIGARDLEAAEAASSHHASLHLQHHRSSRRPSHQPRSASTRRSVRKGSIAVTGGPNVNNSESKQLPKSGSNQSHLAVKNGSSAIEKPEATSENNREHARSGSLSADVKNNITQAEVIVTETETLLPKKDNKPALIVTKESFSTTNGNRRPSTSMYVSSAPNNSRRKSEKS